MKKTTMAVLLAVTMAVASAARAEEAPGPSPTPPSVDDIMKAVEAERGRATPPTSGPDPTVTAPKAVPPDPDQVVRQFRATSRRLEAVDTEVDADIQRLLGRPATRPAAPVSAAPARLTAPATSISEAAPTTAACDLAAFAERLGDLADDAATITDHQVGREFAHLLSTAREAGRACEDRP